MIPGLTESQLWKHATAEVFGRGKSYYDHGAVTSAVQRGQEIQAQVEGSSYEPYRVRVTFDEGGLTGARCSCPYEWGGWCKHIIAVLLTCLHDPEAVEARPALESLLREMSREQLVELVQELAANDPALADHIELRYMQQQAASPEGESRKTAIDVQAIRRRVRAILHALDHMRPSQAYWHVSDVVDEVGGEVERAQTFTEAGDGRNALRYLEAIMDAYVDEWIYLDDSDGEAGGLFTELGEALTDAVLSADLSPDERAAWTQKLIAWQDAVGDYGVYDVFGAAIAAAEQGWDVPALRRVLEEGEITEQGAWAGEVPWYADDLAQARLKVLDRQGRYEEYLRLAEAEGQLAEYLTMLVRLGRIEEAVDQSLQGMRVVSQAFALARALREQGALDEALRVGEQGLTLEGYGKAALATWVSELAQGMGRTEQALQAARVAFQEAPGMDTYRQVQELAGASWPQHREELLERMRRAGARTEAQVEIFLAEGLLDDAIAAVNQHPHYELVRRVVEAVAEARPEWVVRAAKQQAEPIMDEGRSGLYHHAVEWLVHVREAYLRMGRRDEWTVYLAALRDKHGRKYKLMGLIEDRL